MKICYILALTALSTFGATAQERVDNAAGYAQRAAAMSTTSNPVGTANEAQQALRLHDYSLSKGTMPGTGTSEEALWLQARAEMALKGGDPLPLLQKYLSLYPTSGRAAQVRLAIADTYYDRGQWAEAAKAYGELSPKELGPSEAQQWLYRSGFCALKRSDLQQARQQFQQLRQSSSAEYQQDATFYLAYIEYLEKHPAEALKLWQQVSSRQGDPCALTPYYIAQCQFLTNDYSAALASAKKVLASPTPEIAPTAGITGEQYVAETQRIAGESAYALGDTPLALKYLRQYVSATSTPLPSALYILGVEQYNADDYASAISTLTPVAQEKSALGQSAYLYIGQSYLKQGDDNAALLALDQAVRQDYDAQVQEQAFYNYAVAKARGARVPFGSSVGLFEEFLKRYPDSPYASQVEDYVVTGYMTDNNYPAALEALERTRRLTPELLRAKQTVLYTLGSRELQNGQTAQAVGHLRKAATMEADPAVAAQAQLWLGEAYYRQAEYAKAVEAYNAYLRAAKNADSNRALAYFDLGYARFAQKQFPSALADFRKALDISSKLPKGTRFSATQEADAYCRMADCQYYAHDFAAAASDYEKAFALNPATGDYPLYQQGLMKGLRRDHAGKVATLNTLVKTFPSSPLVASALLEMGESYGEMGQTDRAIETYTTLATRHGSSAQGRRGTLLLAMTYLNAGDRAAAQRQYKRVIETWPTSDEARAAADDLRELMADQGQLSSYQAFVKNVAGAPTLDSGEAAATQLRALQRAVDAGRDADAQALAQQLIDSYPDAPEVVKALAIKADLETRDGNARGALETYTLLEAKAADAADTNTARLGLMRLHHQLGNTDRALEYAQKLLESSTLGTEAQREVLFTKALALNTRGDATEARTLWQELSHDRDNLYGAKSSYYLAQALQDAGQTSEALKEVNALIDSNTPHDYWLARGFILLSDIRRAQGKTFEADEYLRSLRSNYPGAEPDILQMISQRLKEQ